MQHHRKVFNKNHKLSRGKRFSLTPMTNALCLFVYMRAWLIQYYDRELRCEDAGYCFKSLRTIIQSLHPIFNKALRVKQQGLSNSCLVKFVIELQALLFPNS